ncbi:SPW repeat domain-containing protein [Streptomyces sp. MA5143a]|uniref:SPW repeat domain-containing protein n=1 Tax=Streptomyces sp. MA5143a TaxID=2083010 RepID=UPI000D1A0EB4|nr:SPW repeat protein [Streptomyces sp. MA5143a]SPE99880.1 SPW repeat [Streptomyces sp. MA5143a]
MSTTHAPDTARPVQDSPRLKLMRAQRQQIIGLLLVLSALVLFVAPWISGYPETAKDAHRNELAVGIIVLLIAVTRFLRYPGKWPDLAVLAAGAWMIASPWVLDTQQTETFDGTQVTDVVVGVVLVGSAAVSLLLLALSQRSAGRERDRTTATTAPGR